MTKKQIEHKVKCDWFKCPKCEKVDAEKIESDFKFNQHLNKRYSI